MPIISSRLANHSEEEASSDEFSDPEITFKRPLIPKDKSTSLKKGKRDSATGDEVRSTLKGITEKKIVEIYLLVALYLCFYHLILFSR